MTIEEVKEYINSSTEYDFLRDYHHKISFLTLGGSYAYGTNTEDSDIDLRGVFISNKREILLNDNTKLVDTKKDTDTVMYTLKKYVDLCVKGNPTMLELLYFAPDRYLYVSDIGMELIKNRDMFLSKRVYHAYKGYICDCVDNSFVICNKTDFIEKTIKVNKSMMHAIRLLLQGIQLIQQGTMCGTMEEIGKDLIDVKMGYNTLCDKQYPIDGMEWIECHPNKSYNAFVERLFSEFEYGHKYTDLPDQPDWNRINDFLMTTNERIVRGMV